MHKACVGRGSPQPAYEPVASADERGDGSAMDPLRTIAETFGFFTSSEALGAGYARRDITRLVRAGAWRRIRRGAYVYADAWAALDDVGRHRVRCSAVLRSLGEVVCLSHVSGVVRHGIDLWGLPLDKVHVTRLDGGPGRIEGDVVHHEGFWTDPDIVEVAGEKVMRAERCVLEAASRTSVEVGLCLLDAGLRTGAFSDAALADRYSLMQHWPFMHRVAGIVPMADGRSESIGESRGRWLFARFGLPAPILQYPVHRPNGTLIGITDWGWPDRGVLGEFDGRVKYGRLLKPGQLPGDAVFEEKRREDELREVTGARVVRVVWDDYDRPSDTAARFARAIRHAG